MGVSGSGKSTLGRALAERLGWTFADADDHHPSANREKMARGQALTDTDRQPWLEALHGLLELHLQETRPLVLACSALKASHRETLTGNLEGIQVVFLQGSREVIAARMRQREHFMPVTLLESQFATLEPPGDAMVLDISQPIAVMIEQVVGQLGQ